jgi:hypothetical protein
LTPLLSRCLQGFQKSIVLSSSKQRANDALQVNQMLGTRLRRARINIICQIKYFSKYYEYST